MTPLPPVVLLPLLPLLDDVKLRPALIERLSPFVATLTSGNTMPGGSPEIDELEFALLLPDGEVDRRLSLLDPVLRFEFVAINCWCCWLLFKWERLDCANDIEDDDGEESSIPLLLLVPVLIFGLH